MRIDFKTDECYEYALGRFIEMSGISKDSERFSRGVDAYERIREYISVRAVLQDFGACVRDGKIRIGNSVTECAALRSVCAISRMYAYVLTAGEIPVSGGTLTAALEDMWGTAFADAGLELLRKRIIAENPGRYVSAPFGPGFYGIKISAVRDIFNALDCRGAGIELHCGLLRPVKSVIGFFAVSDSEIALPSGDCESCRGDTSCEYCKNNTAATVRFARENKTVRVKKGVTVAEAADIAGAAVETPCGRCGKCGKCIAGIETGGNVKFARICVERVYGDTVVYTAGRNTGITVNVSGKGGKGEYFLAADIGTTTVAAELIGGNEIIARAFCENPQAAYCSDVIGRIKLAEKSAAPRGLIIGAINEIINKICEKTGIESGDIKACALSGNTVMQYIAAGYDPAALGRYPYEVTHRFGGEISASEAGINISQDGYVYFPPVISAFVGGDIVSGIIYSRLWEKEGALFADIGTNCELAVYENGHIRTASAAAGPAFEGAGITFGMRAQSGAVSGFKIVNRSTVAVETIDRAPAAGICGSGLSDIIGELAEHGIINSGGAFCDKRLITSPIRNRICEYNGETAFKICGGIFITQSDIRSAQLAKGAVRAGTELLASLADRIIIAGAFGERTGEKSLIKAGIISDRFLNRAEFLGNSSLKGARLLLRSAELRKKALCLAEEAETVLLSENEKFEREFVRYMNFGE